MARAFGEVPGVPPGSVFDSRKATAEAGVHVQLMRGIAGSQNEGAESIVVSGGYEDDEDDGDAIVYTGHGGNDPASGKQVGDQSLTEGNLALAVSADHGLPVRVVRGAHGDPAYSPAVGFRYDGLYYVEKYWQERGKSGFLVWRYRLFREPTSDPATRPPQSPASPPGGGTRSYISIQRVVRNTAITEWVKKLYDYTCQVCGLRLVTAAAAYAEGGHLRPLGRPHEGPDSVDNVLSLCPNDHVLLDRGAIGLDNAWNVIDLKTAAVVRPLTIDPRHTLDPSHAAYHRGMFA